MKNYHGYTLVEILVSISIIGILFGVTFVSFRDFSRRQALTGVVKQIQGDIRLAQQMALSGEKPKELGCLTNNLEGVYFGMTCNPTCLYRIRAVCGNDPTQVSYPIIKEATLPNGITMDIASISVNPIVFKVLGQGTNIPEGESVTIPLIQAVSGSTTTITVTSGGEIK